MMPTHPVFVPAMGLVLLEVGEGLATLRSSLGNRPAVLVPACEKGDLLAQFPELASALLNPAIVNAAGGELALRSVGQCLIGEGCIGESVTTEMGGLPLPLCWHHDNEFRDGQLPFNQGEHAEAIARALLTRVAGWCGVALAQLQARDLCWWASVFKVQGLLPIDVVRHACRLTPVGPDRVLIPGRGYRETDARYRVSRPDLMEQDPLVELRGRLRIKPVVKTIDPEPPMLHIPRPKMKRWESANYLAFVRQLPCVVTGQTDGIEAHHVVGHGLSVMGSKTHDLMTFPLCHQAHMELHNNGWQQWEQTHGSQLDHVAMTLNKAAGLGVFG
ncbi:DUF968 domain-containing protein [Aeromonas salmonicida]|uniref:DUF968 domain-containing protein n=1 Tax=Aeromonas salmonicida TaxID=645 RepID=UPI001F485B68|nr:DUF968 domain-containing protein [Aeromonas salmonicida]MCE9936361.1 DUF968 domain-containing protein [Aeromonas salmonicida]